MRITKIRLENYRCYYGEQVLSIPELGKIIVIRGENGAGKTALLSGLTWCLYNEKERAQELINDKHVDELRRGANAHMSIKVHFSHSGATYIVKRSLTAAKTDDHLRGVQDDYTLEVIRGGKRTRTDDEYEIAQQINTILNESVKSFFCFDGASINTFTRDDHNKDVERAIKNLLKIETIKRARTHIRTVAADILADVKDGAADAKIDEINGVLQKIESEQQQLEADAAAKSRDIKDMEADISRTEKEIVTIETNSIYREQKAKFAAEFDEKREQLRGLQQKLASQLNKSYLCFAQSLFKDVAAQIESMTKSQKREFQADVVSDIIRESLELNACYVCEQPLGGEVRDRLIKRLPSLVTAHVSGQNLFTLRGTCSAMQASAARVYESVAHLKQEANRVEADIDRLSEAISQCDSRINTELPDIAAHRDMLEKLRRLRDGRLRERERIQQDLRCAADEYAAKEAELHSLLAALKKCETDRARLAICQAIRQELDGLYEHYEREETNKIHNQIKEIFDAMIRKQGVYRGIFIDSKYALNVNREYREGNVLSELSYGERQILSLSLILSLAKVSGDEGPFVMDTPMGNLDLPYG